MSVPFTGDQLISIFGDDAATGLMPDHDSDDYLPYIEKVLTFKQKELDETLRDARVTELEEKLHRLSVSSPPVINPAKNQGASGISQSSVLVAITDISKLRLEFYCSSVKSYEKLTFRELIRGCVKVLHYLRLYKVDVEGYLSHIR